eukprot:15296-Eustigmatos_ZCMA.PRE.1
MSAWVSRWTVTARLRCGIYGESHAKGLCGVICKHHKGRYVLMVRETTTAGERERRISNALSELKRRMETSGAWTRAQQGR